ncbi:baseplate J/gp47 family protein [Pseudoflavonifractor phocaeensis]|nr:baseplate J/gp47 family protein [Pseudoflavonifractor phocaeensis]
MVADYEEYMTQAQGVTVSLDRASVHRMILYAAAAQIYQAMQYIDRQGKQSLLKYSYSDYLDNLALFKGVTRNQAMAATCTLRFTLAAERETATVIPQGTRVASSGSVYFATDEYAEIPAGGTTVDVAATCTETGSAGNGLAAGELSTMVDPVPYVASVTNTATTEGGAEIESDADLAERVFLAPGAYSTAGPEDGYLYHAKAYNPAIGDVVATSDQEAGTVDIVFIMADGSTPGPEMINGLKGHLQDKTIRPMTDLVNVSAPEEVQYTINMTYYINRSDSAKAVTIQAAVAQAVEDYKAWQRAIGRDINPSKLVAMVMEAGAKRVTVAEPAYTAVAATKVSALQGEATMTYGGLEDD